jgi:Pyrimidine dimer DNA glycosylase
VRIWSIHPKYLDSKGLVALWREALLARSVLQGRTQGYTKHPQLQRFRAAGDAVGAITWYLWVVYQESLQRGYCFNSLKLQSAVPHPPLTVTTGQLAYELNHLKNKLLVRAPERYAQMRHTTLPDPHPLFKPIDGGVESWERAR